MGSLIGEPRAPGAHAEAPAAVLEPAFDAAPEASPDAWLDDVDEQRFSEITGSSGTGHLQKGHGVAFGDWDRDGNVDMFVELGGAVPGDSYHNVMFQNPGHTNRWLTVKLVGKKTNRAAIGARIKVVTAEIGTAGSISEGSR